MTAHVLAAWTVDIENRLNGTDRLPRTGCAVNVHELKAGLVYRDARIMVAAFPVRHAGLEHAFGFRVENTAQDHLVIRRHGPDGSPH